MPEWAPVREGTDPRQLALSHLLGDRAPFVWRNDPGAELLATALIVDAVRIGGDLVGEQGQGPTVFSGVVAVALPLPEKDSGADLRAVTESQIDGCCLPDASSAIWTSRMAASRRRALGGVSSSSSRANQLSGSRWGTRRASSPSRCVGVCGKSARISEPGRRSSRRAFAAARKPLEQWGVGVHVNLHSRVRMNVPTRGHGQASP